MGLFGLLLLIVITLAIVGLGYCPAIASFLSCRYRQETKYNKEGVFTHDLQLDNSKKTFRCFTCIKSGHFEHRYPDLT